MTTALRNRLFVFLAIAIAMLCASMLLVAAGSAADKPANDATVTPLMTRDLVGIPGKEAVMLTVEYLPGGASLAHRHDANVFVYVLEGTLATQVDGHEKVLLKPGETFYESPADIHRVSANGSATEPAKFLVFMVKDKNKPATRPVP